MKLNHFTDFSMRVLMYLNHQKAGKTTSLDELASQFKISRNHIIKVVQFLSHNDYVITKRGKNGGIIISENARTKPIGDLINSIEQDQSPIINCNDKPCVLAAHSCKLKYIFQLGYKSFLDTLNQFTLANLMFENWDEIFEE